MKEVRTVELNLVKAVLTIAAMTFLYPLLFMIADPVFRCREAATPRQDIGVIGWIFDAAIRVIAVFIVSLIVGVLLPNDRWIARVAATISVVWVLFYDIAAVINLAGNVPPIVVSLLVRSQVIPLVCVTVIVFLCSPFFHDCGRVLRRYLL